MTPRAPTALTGTALTISGWSWAYITTTAAQPRKASKQLIDAEPFAKSSSKVRASIAALATHKMDDGRLARQDRVAPTFLSAPV